MPFAGSTLFKNQTIMFLEIFYLMDLIVTKSSAADLLYVGKGYWINPTNQVINDIIGDWKSAYYAAARLYHSVSCKSIDSKYPIYLLYSKTTADNFEIT